MHKKHLLSHGREGPVHPDQILVHPRRVFHSVGGNPGDIVRPSGVEGIHQGGTITAT